MQEMNHSHSPNRCALLSLPLQLLPRNPELYNGGRLPVVWGDGPAFASLSGALIPEDASSSSSSSTRGVVQECERVVKQTLRFVHRKGREDGMEKQLTMIGKACLGAAAGGIAGGFTNLALHPIDTVKTKLQTRGASQLYSDPFDVVRKVLASQGISGLYSGVHAALWGSVLSSSIYFGTYELTKGMFSAFLHLPKIAVPPLAAALGNIVSSAVLVPKEVVKQRMQAGAIGSTSEVFLQITRSEGVSGLYMGYSAALLRNLPANVISFSTFEFLKLVWLRKSNESVLSPWQSVLSGALAGSLSAAVTTPLDVVKTRLMTQARLAISSSGMTGVKAEANARAQAIAAYTYSGVSATIKQIWMEEGPRALLKGIAPRVFYSACFAALGFCMFESTKVFLLLRYLEWRDNFNKFSPQSEKLTASN